MNSKLNLKNILLSLMIFIGSNSQALVNDIDISGEWKFNNLILDGQVYPAPNPDLDLRFAFYSNQSATLSWHRKDEEGFCERKAFFLLQGDLLYQKTYWLNPKNRADCSRDPDMQLNQETLNHFHLKGKQLFIDLDLSDKTIILVLDLIE